MSELQKNWVEYHWFLRKAFRKDIDGGQYNFELIFFLYTVLTIDVISSRQLYEYSELS